MSSSRVTEVKKFTKIKSSIFYKLNATARTQATSFFNKIKQQNFHKIAQGKRKKIISNDY